MRSTTTIQPSSPRSIITILSFSYILALIWFTSETFAADPHPVERDVGHSEQRAGLDFWKDTASEYNELVKKYMPDFPGINRGIIGRASDDIQELGNNNPAKHDISPGQTQYYSFPKESLSVPKSPGPSGLPPFIGKRESFDSSSGEHELDLRRRQSVVNVYVSLNVCRQPVSSSGSSNSAPAPLRVFLSTTSGNSKPDANNNQQEVKVDDGFGQAQVSTSEGVFIGIEAPPKGSYAGNYNYELTTSIDVSYADAVDDTTSTHGENYTMFADSDNGNALFYSSSVTSRNTSASEVEKWLSDPPPFRIFVHNMDDPSLLGLEKSICALKNLASVRNISSMETRMTAAPDGLVRQEFYVKDLNSSSLYNATITIDGNSTDSGQGVVNGGGTIFPPITFRTKSDNICTVIHGLDFCEDVGYAVPSNPTNSTLSDVTNLANHYDQYAQSAWLAFSKSRQQIPCNTTASAQYSLARNCTDCDIAYKRWLCAVTIPRCEDYSNDDMSLIPRAVNYSFTNASLKHFESDPVFSAENKTYRYFNSSRHEPIDTDIMPGPYKERLPCETLCHELVQSCPAALQFSCPLKDFGLNFTYGKRYSCNSLKLVENDARRLSVFGVLGRVALVSSIMFVSAG